MRRLIAKEEVKTMEKETDFSLEMNEVNIDNIEELEAAVALGGFGVFCGCGSGNLGIWCG